MPPRKKKDLQPTDGASNTETLSEKSENEDSDEAELPVEEALEEMETEELDSDNVEPECENISKNGEIAGPDFETILIADSPPPPSLQEAEITDRIQLDKMIGAVTTLNILDMEVKGYKKKDVQKKLHIASNIVKKCELPHWKQKRHYNLMDVAGFTGVTMATLKKLQVFEDSSVYFKDWLFDTECNNDLYQKIRSHLLDSYTQTREIPTKQWLKTTIKGEHSYSITETLRYLTLFFTSLQIPGTKCSMIVEKPERVMKRFQYLNTKLSYHKQDRTVVYVGASYLYTQHSKYSPKNCSKLFFIAASPKYGYISSLYCRAVEQWNVKKWFMDKVVPVLPPESVIVVDDILWDGAGKVPGPLASKAAMIDWLHAKDIPHAPNTHKAELYQLIETYKAANLAEKSEMEKIVASKGYTILQRPKEAVFDYFYLFWKHLLDRLVFRHNARDKSKNLSKILPFKIHVIAKSLTVKFWADLEMDLRKKEENAYEEDLKMEGIIDKVTTYAKDQRLKSSFTRKLDPYYKDMDKEYIFFL